MAAGYNKPRRVAGRARGSGNRLGLARRIELEAAGHSVRPLSSGPRRFQRANNVLAIQRCHEKVNGFALLRPMYLERASSAKGPGMTTNSLTRVCQRLRRAALLPDGGGLSDGKLLSQFLATRDEAAFEALVRRHGPMVLGVCRRILGHRQDAEDAFQATFLVLFRKGGSVVPRDRVGNWLYGVAYRTALDAKPPPARRQANENHVSPSTRTPYPP